MARRASNATEKPESALRAARRRAGMSQAELADRVGVSASAVARYETELRAFPTSRAVAFAAVLGISVQSILEGSGSSPESVSRWRAVRRDAFHLLSVASAIGLSNAEVDAGRSFLRGIERTVSRLPAARVSILLNALRPLLRSLSSLIE
jgi:transcriptional regulator with XRE-family HTH domain